MGGKILKDTSAALGVGVVVELLDQKLWTTESLSDQRKCYQYCAGSAACESDGPLLLVLPPLVLEPQDRLDSQDTPQNHTAAEVHHLRFLIPAAAKWLPFSSLLQVSFIE